MNCDQKSNELLELLSDLSAYNENIQRERNDAIKKLIDIYSNDFRHSYAKISNKVQILLGEDINCGEQLSQNLQIIKESAEDMAQRDKISNEIYTKIEKLCDHVNLEIGRYNLLINTFDKKIESMQCGNNAPISSLNGISRKMVSTQIHVP